MDNYKLFTIFYILSKRTKQPEEKPSEVKEPEESETEADDNKYPEIEFEGNFTSNTKTLALLY